MNFFVSAKMGAPRPQVAIGSKVAWAAVFLLALLLPLSHNEYWITIASRILIFSILAVSLDLILGYGGMLSLGHAAYFGAGAYVTAAWLLSGSDNGLLHLVSAVLGSAVLALVIGLLCARAYGIYFIMLTFAFAQMIYYTAVGQELFGGDDGVSLPLHSRFGGVIDLGNRVHFFYFSLACLIFVLYGCNRLVHSRFGMVLAASRQNAVRLETLGISPYPYKVTAFAIGGALAGLAGFLAANLNAYCSPNFLSWKVSADLIIMVIVGGVGSLYGGVVGAAVFLLVQEVLSAYTDRWMIIFGPLLVLVALYWNRGLLALFRRKDGL